MKQILLAILLLLPLSIASCSNNSTSEDDSSHTISVDVSGLPDSEQISFKLYEGYSYPGIDSDILTVSTNGVSQFSNEVLFPRDVMVEITAQPETSTCTVNSAFASAPNNDYTFDVICSETAHAITVSVSGLENDQTLDLSLNRNSPENVDGNGNFTFTTQIADGADYEITQTVLPLKQRCTFENSADAITGTATADVTVALTCQRAHILFEASNEFVTGDFGGREDADEICSTYVASVSDVVSCDQVVAFLSVNSSDQISDFPTIYGFDSSLPVYSAYADPQGLEGMRERYEYTRIADDWEDMLDGSLNGAVKVRSFWTGSNSDGTVSENTCSEWTSLSDTGSASAYDKSDSSWLTNATACSQERLIGCACLQNEYQEEIVANFLFHTDTEVAANFGDRDTANALCATDQAASHSDLSCDGVVAFLSYSNDDEVADFPTLYGLDTALEIQDADNENAVVANDWADFMDGSIDTGLTVNWWSGTYFYSMASLLGTSSGFDCSDWTSTAEAEATVGGSGETGDLWGGSSDGSCAGEEYLMCLCYREAEE